jgi:hypothetical protein
VLFWPWTMPAKLQYWRSTEIPECTSTFTRKELLGKSRIWRTSAAPTSADGGAQRAVTSEARPRGSARVRPAIVVGHHLDVFVTGTAVAILVLDARITARSSELSEDVRINP